jgi:hypothetical protein
LAEPRQDASKAIYFDALRRMTPEDKLLRTFDLHEFATRCFLYGLSKRFPDATDDEIRKIYLERIDKCHNRNY